MLEASLKMKLFYPIRPWEEEPDQAEWVQEVSGYKCSIRRNPITGTLCGYVGIPKGHRFFGVGYDEDRDKELGDIADHVHGGLTYSSEGTDGWWYFGFDTSHYNDFSPAVVETLIQHRQASDPPKYHDCMNYKTWEYVDDQIYWLGKRLWQYNEYAKEDRHA